MPADNFLDKAKDVAKDVAVKARKTVGANADKIDSAVDKTAEFVDSKTKGKYSKHIDKAQNAAHGAVDKLAGDDRPDGGPAGSGGEPTKD
jgi:hypothetical protein